MEHDTEFFVILDHFLPFYPPPPNNPKNQNFEKMKKKPNKTPRDIIILHTYTINDNHIMYVSGDMECDGQIFLLFWTILCPFTPTMTQRIKILKK